MRILKKAISITTLVMMLCGVVNPLNAQGCNVADAGGCGYIECRRAPCITPAVALGTIGLVAVIAVALQTSSRSVHAHAHSACGCNSSS